ncbi:hypothetical protein PQ469_02775 [Mucilaginibacter sp. KACC 22773]|uniref:hypothetical protein n=1 Tax=Mucilaginibacter sp. KACC 22773 TaxID=3025671 RepID=UPI0023672609|nr:hypothetical protein [Mucilaginibacter sp. KACC 22773]WDF78928.1 hypothetical protein PQ469_02775 [Mucilaginibacter sp. KACC 22773]
MIKKIYILVIFTIVTITTTLAQEQTIDIHFNALGFLDNREYKAFIPRSRTYSGMRTELDLGWNIDSLNHFVFGANGIHEFGAKPYFLKVNPVAYYNFTGKSWLFYAGAFPREGLLDDYPRAILNDTLRYYRPNIEGLLARVHNEHFTETGWIDWVSRQTQTDREQFLFGFSGKYKPSVKGPFYVSHYFMLMHDAGAEIAVPNDNIRDNGAGQIRLGLDFSHKTFLDSLSVEAGGMMSLERVRGVDGFHKPAGFVANVYLSYNKFALFDEFYKGQGHEITYGDSWFEKKTYNRMDIIWTPFLYNRVKGQFILSFHQTPGFRMSNQEAFRITVDLGRKTLIRMKN